MKIGILNYCLQMPFFFKFFALLKSKAQFSDFILTMTNASHRPGDTALFRKRSVAAWLRRHGLTARLQNALAGQAPVGYEDDTGFHVGVNPSAKSADYFGAPKPCKMNRSEVAP